MKTSALAIIANFLTAFLGGCNVNNQTLLSYGAASGQTVLELAPDTAQHCSLRRNVPEPSYGLFDRELLIEIVGHSRLDDGTRVPTLGEVEGHTILQFERSDWAQGAVYTSPIGSVLRVREDGSATYVEPESAPGSTMIHYHGTCLEGLAA